MRAAVPAAGARLDLPVRGRHDDGRLRDGALLSGVAVRTVSYTEFKYGMSDTLGPVALPATNRGVSGVLT